MYYRRYTQIQSLDMPNVYDWRGRIESQKTDDIGESGEADRLIHAKATT